MEYADKIACIINDSLKALPLNASIYGVARLLVDKRDDAAKGGTTSPAIVDLNGEGQTIEFEGNEVVAYHRCLSIVAGQSNKQGYGRSLNPLNVKMKMCLVVFSDITKTKLSPDQMALNIFGLVPRNMIKTLMPGVKNTSILINDTILNESQVYSEEFKNIDSFIGPEHSLIKINYTVESTVSPKCFNTICNQTS